MTRSCELCAAELAYANNGPICAECFLLLRNGDLGVEVWRKIPSHPRFQMSNLGHVRGTCTRRLCPPDTSGRYPRISIEGKRYALHVLLARTWLGPRPRGLHVLHADDDPQHCTLANIAYGTPAENRADAVRNGRIKTATTERQTR
ncbi:hypothetical protein A5634_18150 [Mycobacterium asiaticum]|uniref:HNH nuclease domain-containing protein n=1 Tax=Mycobacterium asiaticum TaxID=1790 RepID=A0A1A3P789_MYCAS|nr:HNH endonuclease [Mycobacterium asiaticum]OBK29530.1 hypothetical protein A5634_18150 [Mycobacterium asiaticum]